MAPFLFDVSLLIAKTGREMALNRYLVLRAAAILLVILAAISFYLGVSEPLMVFERFFLWETTASLLEIIGTLWTGEDWFLAIIVALFSVAFPILKLAYLGAALLLPAEWTATPLLSFLSTLSKWSMLDVLVVAVLIVATKTTGLATALTQPGLWYFAGAVLLMSIVTVLVPYTRR
ncbi:MAG: paraquat-inducible protein A [Pseudomonadota bacterium]